MIETGSTLTKLKQCRYGPMLFLQTDRYVGGSLDAYGEYCHGESVVFEQMVSKGQTIVEIGANIGAHTVHLAKLVGPAGRVVAFEPQRVIFQILCANIALNDCFNVQTLNAASGSEPGKLLVPPVDYGHPESNFGGVSLIGIEHGEEVPIIPLDSLPLSSLRVLKVDVEGMETPVLQGARNHIARFRPIIYVENDRPEQSPGLIRLIQEMGYNLWWHLPALFNPDNANGRTDNIFGAVCSINMICLPAEAANVVTGFRQIHTPDDRWQAA